MDNQVSEETSIPRGVRTRRPSFAATIQDVFTNAPARRERNKHKWRETVLPKLC